MNNDIRLRDVYFHGITICIIIILYFIYLQIIKIISHSLTNYYKLTSAVTINCSIKFDALLEIINA